MKWKRYYNVDISEIHRLNLEGYSLPELSKKFGIPRTTLNRYLHSEGYDVLHTKYRTKVAKRRIIAETKEFKCTSAWKRSLIRKLGPKCMICGYETIIEAHHIIPMCDGGKTTIENGCLLCPNHHAEAHVGILSKALLKRDELLESRIGNQQPSLESKWLNPPRVKEGSTTNARAKAVIATRASRNIVNVDDIV